MDVKGGQKGIDGGGVGGLGDFGKFWSVSVIYTVYINLGLLLAVEGVPVPVGCNARQVLQNFQIYFDSTLFRIDSLWCCFAVVLSQSEYECVCVTPYNTVSSDCLVSEALTPCDFFNFFEIGG